MKLHEYQAKTLLKSYQIPVPDFQVATTVKQARDAAEFIGGHGWVIKAQIHAGGRGKAGGVHMVSTLDELERSAFELLGSTLITDQTGPMGQPVEAVLIEPDLHVEKEFYLAMLVDRESKRVTCMVSPRGGEEIEEIAGQFPDQIGTVKADPVAGLQPFHCRYLALKLGLEFEQRMALSRLIMELYQLFKDKDLSLIEINPLGMLRGGQFIVMDAKIVVDENAMFRQTELLQLRDASQEDLTEVHAQEHGLTYVSLNGNIGCLVNGAGLAMATMDLIKLHGGDAANFLDVGGGTSLASISEAFRLLSKDKKIDAILVNIFGGIVRCDLVAQGIIDAISKVGVSNVPIVVRLEGTNKAEGQSLLANCGLNVFIVDELNDAARKVVELARR